MYKTLINFVVLFSDMESILLKVTALCNKIETCDVSGQFEWVDSILVKAVKYGHWLMISHANFCRLVD